MNFWRSRFRRYVVRSRGERPKSALQNRRGVASWPVMNASSLVPDGLWEAIEPLLPKEPPKPRGGRPRVADRAALRGIVFVLRTGCPWRLLPKELGCGSGSTCWRRLRDWQEAGVWQRLHETLLNWLGDEAAVDWSRASVDSLSVRAKRGASRRGQTPSIAGSSAPITTWWSIARASRWPCVSRRPTPTMRRSSSRLSTPSLRSSAHGGSPVVLASAPPSCTPTRPTTPRTYAALSAPAASRHVLLDAASTPASGWGATAGWWSAPLPGCSAAAGSGCATSGELPSSRRCCTWLAR
jgi:transposase